MEIQGEQNLTVPRGDVWRALNDPAVLQRCLPGCDTFESDGDNRYRVAMQAAVGPVRARFAGKLQLSDIVAPGSYALSFEGSGGVAGFGKGTAQVRLEDVAGGTRLRYSAQAQVGGRLAQVGARLIDGVTRRMADDFFTRFARELNVQEGGAAAAALPSLPPMATPVQPPAAAPEAARPPSSPQATQIAVIAAAVAATAAAVAVLAALYVVQFAR
ncbi:MAG: carbon monoxide dehydrogenase subunit G [Ramlibacter sp.]|nr:carbon monoxide dehydrogenase subunit G [Ramlibacter sp.]